MDQVDFFELEKQVELDIFQVSFYLERNEKIILKQFVDSLVTARHLHFNWVPGGDCDHRLDQDVGSKMIRMTLIRTILKHISITYFREALCNLATFLVIVAENNMVLKDNIQILLVSVVFYLTFYPSEYT